MQLLRWNVVGPHSTGYTNLEPKLNC
jgi:hypothetical protein